jgi:hypothetical protein
LVVLFYFLQDGVSGVLPDEKSSWQSPLLSSEASEIIPRLAEIISERAMINTSSACGEDTF